MRIAFRRKSVKIKSAVSFKDLLLKLGQLSPGFLIAATIIGYPLLLSYTWTLGFVPIISIESLPIFLIGFALLLLFISVFGFLLYFPFAYLGKKEPNKHTLLFDEVKNYYGLASLLLWLVLFGMLYLIGMWQIILILLLFLVEFALYSQLKLGKLWFFSTSVVLLLFAGYIFWQLDSSWISFFPQIGTIFLVGSMLTAVRSRHFNKHKLQERVSYFLVLIFIVAFLPVILTKALNDNDEPTPNWFVQSGLRLVKLGGEIPVRIRTSGKENIEGLLMFYDGKKAWVRKCPSIKNVTKSDENSDANKKSEPDNQKSKKQVLKTQGSIKNKRDDANLEKGAKKERAEIAASKTNMNLEQKNETIQPVVTELVVSRIDYFGGGYDICQKASGVQAKQAEK